MPIRLPPASPSAAALRTGERLWGEKPPAPVKPKAYVKIPRWTPYRNAAGTVRGNLSAQMPSGAIYHELKLMMGVNGKFWIARPTVKQTNKDGTPRLGPDGKQLWSPIIEFVDKATREQCGELILEALRRQHPDALDDLEDEP